MRPNPTSTISFDSVWVTIHAGKLAGFKSANLILNMRPLADQLATVLGQQLIIKYSELHVLTWNIFPDKAFKENGSLSLPYGLGVKQLAAAIEVLAPNAQRAHNSEIVHQLLKKLLSGNVKLLKWPQMDQAKKVKLTKEEVRKVIPTVPAAAWLRLIEEVNIKPLELPTEFHPHIIPQAL